MEPTVYAFTITVPCSCKKPEPEHWEVTTVCENNMGVRSAEDREGGYVCAKCGLPMSDTLSMSKVL